MVDPVEDAITTHHSIQEMEYKVYRQACDEHTPCLRCKDWSKMGLSNTCPTCDERILNRMEELRHG